MASTLPFDAVEVLCSWNGNENQEQNINNLSGYEFLIAQRQPYNFASNINSLAEKANGEYLVLANDDLILDEFSLDEGIACLQTNSQAGLVGALLRHPNGLLQHGGFSFDNRHNPYHVLEGLIESDAFLETNDAVEVPAVTGALVVIRRDDFLKLRLNESYQRCGEDVELSLTTRGSLKKAVLLAPRMSAIHAESATRKEEEQTGDDSVDLANMRMRRRQFLEQASPADLRVEMHMQSRELEGLRKLLAAQAIEPDYETIGRLERDVSHWRRQTNLLQLEMLRLRDSVQRHQNP